MTEASADHFERAFAGARWRLVSAGAAGVGAVVWAIIAARGLTIEQLARYALSLSVGTVAGSIASSGLGGSLQACVARQPDDRLQVLRGAVPIAARGTLAIIIAAVVASAVSPQRADIWIGAAVVAIGFVAQEVSLGWCRGAELRKRAEGQLVAGWIATLVLSIALIGLGSPSGALVAAVRGVASAIAALLALPVLRAFAAHRASAKEVLGLKAVAAAVAVATLAWSGIQFIDVIAVSLLRPALDAALYQPMSRYLQIALSLSVVPGAYYIAVAGGLLSRGLREEAGNLYVTLSRMGLLFGAIPAVALFVAPTAVLTTAFGERFAEYTTVPRVLAAGYLVNMALGLNVSAMVAAGRQRLLAAVCIAGLGVAVVVIPAATWLWGPLGAAVGATTVTVGTNVAVSLALYATVGIHPIRRSYTAAVGLVVVGAALGPITPLPADSKLACVAVLAVAGMAFVAAAVVLTTDDERASLRRMTTRRIPG